MDDLLKEGLIIPTLNNDNDSDSDNSSGSSSDFHDVYAEYKPKYDDYDDDKMTNNFDECFEDFLFYGIEKMTGKYVHVESDVKKAKIDRYVKFILQKPNKEKYSNTILIKVLLGFSLHHEYPGGDYYTNESSEYPEEFDYLLPLINPMTDKDVCEYAKTIANHWNGIHPTDNIKDWVAENEDGFLQLHIIQAFRRFLIVHNLLTESIDISNYNVENGEACEKNNIEKTDDYLYEQLYFHILNCHLIR